MFYLKKINFEIFTNTILQFTQLQFEIITNKILNLRCAAGRRLVQKVWDAHAGQI